jgi:hypothetical protein
MKKHLLLPGLLCILFSCKKENVSTLLNSHGSSSTQFTKYTIRKGQNYCDESSYTPTSYSQLSFVAKFDSTAIYSTINADNQADINKLYGFADNNSTHQQFSARFGWRWSNNALRLFGYVYNDGIRSSKELGVVIHFRVQALPQRLRGTSSILILAVMSLLLMIFSSGSRNYNLLCSFSCYI